jgi:hypothetical protein
MGAERYNASRIGRHASYPRHASIVVCADQRVPRGWRRQQQVDEVEYQSLCRSSRQNRPVAERVMRILREG